MRDRFLRHNSFFLTLSVTESILNTLPYFPSWSQNCQVSLVPGGVDGTKLFGHETLPDTMVNILTKFELKAETCETRPQ